MDPGEWIHSPRLPLIDPYRGVCRAADPFEADEKTQRDLCNWGCARGRCQRLPREGADAVRFAVFSEDSTSLRVVYIYEKDCAPVDHGIAEDPFDSAPEILRTQLRAFAQSYRRRMDHFQSSRGGENVSIATASSSTSAE
ncbi:MAG TPA: hypothetical protein VMG40_20700 [Bryobacteraceae bacterium]|nr:hypothetical protein [Bryobacteraceae bacterium]